jgi:hypothetical protein
MLVAFLVPSLARAKERARRISCVSNLKILGFTQLLWTNDHGAFAFASTNAESSLRWADTPQVYRHFQVLSNELVTPYNLFCPSDAARFRTTNFNQLSNSNLSYFVGLEAVQTNPQHILSGDRNLTGGTLSNGFMRRYTTGPAGWTKELHNQQGDVGLADGSVQLMTEFGLTKQIELQQLPVTRFAIP